MGIKVNLRDIEESEELRELRGLLQPRNQCRTYLSKKGSYCCELLTKEEFDSLFRLKSFNDGPYIDTFGDNEGEPYYPDRQAFGTLKDGRIVYCEQSKLNQERVSRLNELLSQG